MEFKKRATAYKLKIIDILNSADNFNVETNSTKIDGKEVIRANIIANVIDKFESETEKKFGSLTVDDGTGQIRLKVFSDSMNRIEKIQQGDTVYVIGMIRFYNNEIYLIPEIVKQVDTKWLLIRNYELGNKNEQTFAKQERINQPRIVEEKIAINKDSAIALEIIQKLKEQETIDIEKLIMSINAPADVIKSEIDSLLAQSRIYEPMPSKLRLLE